MGHTDIPPWEPIAGWLARLPEREADAEHEDTRLGQNASQKEIRERYEKTAKAIAYDIATATQRMADDAAEDMKHELPEYRADDIHQFRGDH